jgi:hypothetical protein
MLQAELNAQNCDQRMPRIAMDQYGNFVVVCEDDRDGNGVYDIYARGFYVSGTEHFSSRIVNLNINGNQKSPQIAMNNAGDFVVVWEDDQDGNSIYNIYMRGFNPDGTVRFEQKKVNNSSSSGQKYKPAIAMSANGNFIVCWEDDQNNNGSYDISMCGFNSDGTELFAQSTVNINTAGQQFWPGISMDDAGNFVVVWQDDLDNNGFYEIKMRGFNPDGTERFEQTTVNTNSSGQQKRPEIAMSQSGNFVVTWEDDQDNNGYYDIRMRGFTPYGTERFTQFKVNTNGGGQQYRAGIVSSATGEFVVVWEDDNDNNGVYDIYARGFYSNGTERFADITINTVTAGQQRTPAIDMDNQYNFVVVWGDDQDEDGYFQILAKGFNSYGLQRFPDIIVTSVASDLNPAIVEDFKLFQNYPNPFNPGTIIEFSLPENVNNAMLSIYNVLGEKITELVNSALIAGKYSYTWNAQNLATGIYIYELRTEKFSSIKKMILMK